jgi:hypothetical protein
MNLQPVWQYSGTQTTLFFSPLPSCYLFWSAVVTAMRATARCCQLQVIKTDNSPSVVSSVWSLKRTYVFDMITETLVSFVLDARVTGRHFSNALISVELQEDELKCVQTVVMQDNSYRL